MIILDLGIQIGLILFGAMIAMLSSFIIWRYRLDYSKKNIAFALLLEISKMEHSLIEIANIFKNDDDDESMTIIPQTIYPDKGLYYVFQKDISMFQKNLSNLLYEFYQNLMIAEEERRLINWIKEHYWADIPEEAKPELQKQWDAYKEPFINKYTISPEVPHKIQMKYVGIHAANRMKNSIIRSSDLILKIKTMLVKECNLSSSELLDAPIKF